jgi:hypothetical protein
MRQLDDVRVSIATDITQTFLLNLRGIEIHSNPVRGQVSLSYTGNVLNLLMTKECAAAKCPPYELVALIAEACEIKDANYYSLLYTALGSSSTESIFSTFAQQGIYIKGLAFGMPWSYLSYPKTNLWTQPSRKRDTKLKKDI